jgi:hypothetical protein
MVVEFVHPAQMHKSLTATLHANSFVDDHLEMHSLSKTNHHEMLID